MKIRRVLVPLALALALTSPARAGDPEGRRAAVPEEVADEVVRVHAAPDATALAELARGDAVCPWLVVDVLLTRGAVDAAKAFAARVEGREAGALRAFAARPLREPSGVRATLAAAQARLASGDAAQALRLLEAAGDVLADGVLRGAWYELLGDACVAVGRTRDAARAYRDASAVVERLGWDGAAALLARAAGATYLDAHDLPAATIAWRRLAEIHARTGDRTGEAGTWMDLGVLAYQQGDDQAALDLLARARERAPADDAALLAMIATRAAAAHERRGAYAVAFDLLTQTIASLPDDTAAVDRREVVDAMASLHFVVGDYDAARHGYEQALAAAKAFEAAATTDADKLEAALGVATEEGNLALVLAMEGDYDLAAAGIEAARARFVAGSDEHNAARALGGLAYTRADQGRFADAKALATAAEAEGRAVGDPSLWLNARISRARAEEGLGNLDGASTVLDAVFGELDRRTEPELELDACRAAVRVRLARGDAVGAMDVAQRAFHRIAEAYDGLSDPLRIAGRSQYAEIFEDAAAAAVAAKDDRRLFRFVESGRASTLLSALGNREALHGGKVPPALDAARVRAAKAVATARGALEEAGDDRARVVAARGAFDAAVRGYEAAVAAIQRQAREAAHVLFPQPMDLADAVAHLAADEALVLFAVAHRDAGAFVVTRAGGRWVRLGEAEAARAACRGAALAGAEPEAAVRLQAALDGVWGPAAAALPDAVRRVYVSPDGDLGLLPYAALDADPARARRVILVPSATTLDVLRAHRARIGHDVLAVAISEYGAIGSEGRSEGLLRGRSALTNLPAAEREAKAVGDTTLLGKAATEDALRGALGDERAWSAIHFAVHGRLDPRRPTLSWLALAPTPESDGYLTAIEIFQHDVHADLVVLAACDSGGGVPVAGEGLVGLVRAFLFAGCPRVVANLWTVDDDASLAFATALHARWKAGASLSDALAYAQTVVRNDPRWAHPYYWAGWCAWGLGT